MAATIQANGGGAAVSSTKRATLVDQHLDSIASGKSTATKDQVMPSKKRKGEGEIELDSKKLKAHLENEKRRKNQSISDMEGKYNSNRSAEEVTEEELEAYRMSRRDADDPMAAFLED